MSRISGRSFDFYVGDMLVHADKVSLDIEDNRSVAKNRGVPNGTVSGDVGASGSMELDPTAFGLIVEAARSAGSFEDLADKPFDCVFHAETSQEKKKIEAFGCVFKIESLLDADTKGGDKDVTKLAFDVTSPDFIRINGVPYLSEASIKDLV
ncbi:phage protein [Pseudodesulfovibrio sp.]|uniref:phage protein n=1 Tax=unclassified Pseudodesulfovibrio TaxID=2661612 RepID=UPI003AFF8E82